nr:MAG: hypothetical protein AM324_13070 [Candidatus Thorarchaeota archaeon SMTZ1-83]
MDNGPKEAQIASTPYIAHSTLAMTSSLGSADSVSSRLYQQTPRPCQRRGPFVITNYGEYRVD